MRIGIGLLAVFSALAALTCGGAAYGSTGDTGDTGIAYVTYYRGSGCILTEGCDTCGCDTTSRAPVGALFLVVLLAVRRREGPGDPHPRSLPSGVSDHRCFEMVTITA